MPINADYEYFEAEKKYLEANTQDEKIVALEELIRKAPKHKSSENLLAGLRLRLKKLKERVEKAKKVGGGKKGLKKEGYQVVLVGMPNSGKSSLLSALTNARPPISPYPYTTQTPGVGSMDYEGVKAQIVDLPSIGGAAFDIGIVNTADCIVIVLSSLDELPKIQPLLGRTVGEKLTVVAQADTLSDSQRHKLESTSKSKHIGAYFVSSTTGEGITDLKKAIFGTMHMIRIYTKEPGKPRSPMPVVLPEGSLVRDVAESIRNGFSRTVKESRLTGPSAKFINQKVGLLHKLKDRDVVEFHTS